MLRHPGSGLAASPIAGRGLFTVNSRRAGDVLAKFESAPTSETELGPVNHSCDPNAGWAADGSMVALRDIPAGTELVTDYAMLLDDPDYLLRCHCETYRCRQLIQGDDWQIPQLRQRYAGHWSPRLRDTIAAS